MKRNKRMDYEIKFYEGVIKRAPCFIEALAALGDLYTQRGFYEKGLNVDLKLAALRPNDPTILYNLSCSYSLMDQLTNALSVLKKALACGYDDFDHLESDNDLANLRAHQEFNQIVKTFKAKKGIGC